MVTVAVLPDGLLGGLQPRSTLYCQRSGQHWLCFSTPCLSPWLIALSSCARHKGPPILYCLGRLGEAGFTDVPYARLLCHCLREEQSEVQGLPHVSTLNTLTLSPQQPPLRVISSSAPPQPSESCFHPRLPQLALNNSLLVSHAEERDI